MAGKLQTEIKQTRPFQNIEEEVFLNLLRTVDALSQGEAVLLKRAHLSPAQYNVLRILRGAGPEGLSCREISERMITRDPDVTRLLDRLEARKLATRTRPDHDRRVVRTCITPEGLRLISELDAPLAAQHKERLSHMNRQQLRSLIDLLEQARRKSK